MKRYHEVKTGIGFSLLACVFAVSLLLRFFKESFLAHDDDSEANADGRVGDVKNRTEKLQLIATKIGHSFGPVGIYNGKIKNVNYITVQPGRVAALRG